LNSGDVEAVHNGKVAARMAGRAAARAKWPPEVATIQKGVMQGYRQMKLPRRQFRYFWRSLKGKGFWLTAKDMPVFYGKTLREATIAMVRTLPEYQDCTVMD
jgi:hypothetical protein